MENAPSSVKVSNSFYKVLYVLIFSISMVFSAWLISTTGFTIRGSAGGSVAGANLEGISVNGIGEVMVKPDMVTISVTARERAISAQDAQQKLNRKVNLLIDAIKRAGVKDEDISTSSYSSYSYWWWDWDKERVVTQGFQVEVKDIDKDEKKLGNVIDAIIAVDAQTGWGLRFDLEDKTDVYEQARELAHEKALQKANQLAKVSKVKLGEVIYISDKSRDSFSSDYEKLQPEYMSLSMADEYSGSSGTNIPVGDIKVVVELDLRYEIL